MPEAAAEVDHCAAWGHGAALETPRRPDARQLPHQQPEIEAADVHEQPLQDVVVSAQMHPPHPPGLVEMRVGALEPLPALPQQPVPRAPRIRRRLA